VPEVYVLGEATTGNGFEIPMFLGEWFESYHEFHLSFDEKLRKNRIQVWEGENRFFLTENQEVELYRQVARILTRCYNIETFEHVGFWHHAAGDFILRSEPDSLDLKLITIRQYAPLIETDEKESSAILGALLMYFIYLSIWTRLDRLDGVGDIVWSNETAVMGTWNGFFEALKLKPSCRVLPEPVGLSFKKFLRSLSEDDLFQTADLVLDTFHPNTPELPVIRKNILKHIHELSLCAVSADDPQ
jgi:hypothetical protein